MKRMLLGILLGLSLTGARAVAAEPPPAELLARLAEQEARVGKVMKAASYTLSSQVEELDGDGKLLHTRQSVAHVSTGADGQKRVELQKVLVDGKDVTAAEKGKDANKKSRELESPFAAAAQPGYRYSLVGPDAKDPSKLRLHFEPKQPSPTTYVGEALVDPSAGEVLWIKERPAQNPSFVDRMEVEVELSTPTALGRQMTSVRVEGLGGVLFYKRGFKVRLSFSDYDVGAAASAK